MPTRPKRRKAVPAKETKLARERRELKVALQRTHRTHLAIAALERKLRALMRRNETRLAALAVRIARHQEARERADRPWEAGDEQARELAASRS